MKLLNHEYHFHRYLLVGVALTALSIPCTTLQAQSSETREKAAADKPANPAGNKSSHNEIVVTAQKIEQRLQDVPIAVTAYSGDGLDNLKIERGEELLRGVPNVTFSKSNFSGYNFSIRGIGTKAISASTDPAVAISFNNTALLRNRLFEQEFFDIERVEVLRGPQGTLYGRNSTGGVVNILPVLPSFDLGGRIKAEYGSFETRRISGDLNVPLSDSFALRFAGALTKRNGFDFNSFTGNDINDRDLYSTRLTALWEPSDSFRVNALWQHFNEDDRRSRTGKQLCTRDPGPSMIGATEVPSTVRPSFSQSCLPGSLYADAAFDVPNAAGLPFVVFPTTILAIGNDEGGNPVYAITPNTDPYAGQTQSQNLREIAASYDPIFRAQNDLFQLNLELDLNDSLSLVSQSTYAKDNYYSSQDYYRFVSNPVFNDSEGLYGLRDPVSGIALPLLGPGPTPGGIYTDPQLGPSNRILAVDISRSDSDQWSQEFRLQSSFDGSFNFNLGANYLNFQSIDDYYVFNNLFSLIAEYAFNIDAGQRPELVTSNCDGLNEGRECIYVDPNPLDQIDNQGHNYFRSHNPIKTESWAFFGETYWQAADNLKFTGGLRYTRDEKTARQIPSQLLLGAQNFGMDPGFVSGGLVSQGYPESPPIKQRFSEFTGRFVADWQPEISFTEDTLIYASYARGFKSGGTNPPPIGLNLAAIELQPLPNSFDPEFVNAFEIGTKNRLLDGDLTFNATGFFYDYQDYQISQITDRIALNENFDAEIWGLELETVWQPSRNFRVDANLGYLQTRITESGESIDVLNRTQGNPDWVVVRPHLLLPSNCIAPTAIVEQILNSPSFSPSTSGNDLGALCGGASLFGTFNSDIPAFTDLAAIYGTGDYSPLTDAPNGGRGFYADLLGNELPNSPRFTFNIGAQYLIELGDWEMTLRGDYYRQSSSFARVYNSEIDRLRGWDNYNAAVTLANPDLDLTLQFYVKNIFNDAPITDAFTNSDDTGLTTNVFTLEPRIFGFSVSKSF